MFLEIVFYILIGFLTLSFLLGILGPKLWDRILSLNLVTIKTILIIVVYSSMENSSVLLDVAIIYALLSFIGTIFLALFLAERKKREQK